MLAMEYPQGTVPGTVLDLAALQNQLNIKEAELAKALGTLSHYRQWAQYVQHRYHSLYPEASRPARRIYVGGLPSATTDVQLREFFNSLMERTGASVAPGSAVASCKIYPEKNYAFLEFRSIEEASNCMAFDGISFQDTYLKIRRPNNYDEDLSSMMGPKDPDPTVNLAELNIVKTVVVDSPHKLFIGGLPCDWTEDQVKEILLPISPLKAFNLVMDKNTGNSKGYAFCEFADTTVTDQVIGALNGKAMGNKYLTVKRAVQPSTSY